MKITQDRPHSMNIVNPQIFRKTLNLFFTIFLITGGIISGLTSVFYRSEIDSMFTQLKKQEDLTVAFQERIITDKFDTIIGDLLFLGQQNELIDFLDTNDRDYLDAIELEYIEISHHRRIFDQLRYLDNSGKERVRVNYNKGNVAPVPVSKLQDKSKRYYFADAIILDYQEVFTSPFDLNVENGEIEQPLKPMIRFGTPVFNSANQKSGLLLINYLAKTLLDDLSRAGELSIGSLMLLNKDSYWLMNQSDKETEWGFMYPEQKSLTFANQYPDEWEAILNSKSGQMQTSKGLFTFTTVYPLERSSVVVSENYSWIIVSYIPQSILGDYKNDLLVNLFIFDSALFILIALGSWFTALTIIRKRLHTLELAELASQDTLTSLPNRRECLGRLKSSLELAHRFERKMGILFIDLDGFKEVNDTFGHAAGDELLVTVSKRISSTARNSDVVCRFGGDEFVCILSEIDSEEGAMQAGNRIVESLNIAVELSSGTANIGASVGVAIYPDHATGPEELLHKADKAMYVSKTSGKNLCTCAEV